MSYYISQLFGIVASGSAIASMQLKKIRGILICQIICNGTGLLSYLLLSEISACGIYLIALAQTVVCYFFRRKDKKIPTWLGIVFVISYLICSLTTFNRFIDLFSTVAALTCALSLLQEKASKYRVFMLLNGITWLIYDICVGAYSMMISHLATFSSAATGIIRLDIRKANDKNTRE